MNIDLLNKDIFSLAKYNDEGNEKYYFLENNYKGKKNEKNYQEFFYLKTNIDIEQKNINLTLYAPFIIEKDNEFNNKPLLERINLFFSSDEKIDYLKEQGLNYLDIEYLKGLTKLSTIKVGCLTGSKFEDKVIGNDSIGGTGLGKRFSVFNYKYAYGKTMFQKNGLELSLKEYLKLLKNYILIEDTSKFISIKDLQIIKLKEFNKFHKNELEILKNFDFKEKFVISKNIDFLVKKGIFKKDILTNLFYNIEFLNKNNLLFKNIINVVEETKEFNDKYYKHKIFSKIIDNKCDLNDEVYYLQNLHNIYVDSNSKERKTFRFFDNNNNNKCQSLKINENMLNNIALLSESIEEKEIKYVFYLKLKKDDNVIEKIYFADTYDFYQFIEKVENEIREGNIILDVSINDKKTICSSATLIENKEETILLKQTLQNYYKKINNFNNIKDEEIFENVKELLIEEFKNDLKYQSSKTKDQQKKFHDKTNDLKILEELYYSEENSKMLIDFYCNFKGFAFEQVKDYIKNNIRDKEQIKKELKIIYGKSWFNSLNFKQKILKEIKKIPKEDKSKISFKNSFKLIEKEYLFSDEVGKQTLKNKEKDILKKLSLVNFNYIENVNNLYRTLYYNNDIKIEFEKKNNFNDNKIYSLNYLFKFMKEYYFNDDKSLNMLLKQIIFFDNEKIKSFFKTYLYKIHDSGKLNSKNSFQFKILLKLLNSKDFDEILEKYFVIFLKNLIYGISNDNSFILKTYKLSFNNFVKDNINVNDSNNVDNLNFYLGKSIYKIKSAYFNKFGKNEYDSSKMQIIDLSDILIEHTNQEKLKNSIKIYLKKYGEYIAKNHLNFDDEFDIIEQFFKNEFELDKDLVLSGMYGV